MPCHHALVQALRTYIDAAGIVEDRKGWLFPTARGHNGSSLSDKPMSQPDAWRMIRRRITKSPADPTLRSVGYPPAQIKDAAGDKDGQKPLDCWRDRFGLEMLMTVSQRTLAKLLSAMPSSFCDAIEARKDGGAKMDLRMSPPRLGQESF